MVESTVGEPFVDADDIADVAVATLLDPAHIGRIYELTGPRRSPSRTWPQRSALSPDVHSFQALPVHDYEAALVSAGLGEGDASGLAHIFEEALDGRTHTSSRASRTCSPGNRETSKPSPRMRLSRVPPTDDLLVPKGSGSRSDPPPPEGVASGPSPR